jgi:hypothetical protein
MSYMVRAAGYASFERTIGDILSKYKKFDYRHIITLNLSTLVSKMPVPVGGGMSGPSTVDKRE